MLDCQQVADDVRSFLASADQQNSNELADLAQSFATLCSQANDRLRRCIDFLHRGLRSEAIHLADAQPVLLDMIAALDLREFADWENVCSMYGLPRPPRIRIELAAELNEAYALEQPLQSLLSRHRVLALARAPLPERIEIMRQLAEYDVGNPVWEEDVSAFETARLREVRAECAAALKDKSQHRLSKLFAEVDGQDWRIKVPEDLKRTVAGALRQVTHADATARLRQMLPALHNAYAAMLFDDCQSQLAQWRDVAAAADLTVPAELQDQVEPIIAWVKEQQNRRKSTREFEAACAQLASALDADAATDEIERLHRPLVSGEHAIPVELQRAFDQKLEARTLARRRRVRRNVALIASGLVACAVAIGLVIYSSGQRRNAEQLAKDIDAKIASFEFAEASDLWNSIEKNQPVLAKRSELTAARSRLEQAKVAEDARAENFRKQMAAALASGVDRPNAEALKSASELARTAPEKDETQAFSQKVNKRQQQLQAQRDDAFSDELAKIDQQLKQLDRDLLSNKPAEFGKQLDDVEKLAASLATRRQVSDIAMGGLRALQKRMSILRGDYSAAMERQSEATREAADLNRIAEAAPSARSLTASLTAFAQKFPNSDRSAEFAKAVESTSAWEAAEAWGALVDSWNGQLIPSSQRDLNERSKAIEAYLERHPASPFAANIQKYRDYQQSRSQALSTDGPWRKDLRGILTSPLMWNVRSVRTRDGRRYYLVGDAKYKEDARFGPSFNAVLSSDVNTTKNIRLKPTEGASKPELSPQSRLSEALSSRVEKLTFAECDTFGLDIASEISRQTDLDPILKVILMERILRLSQPPEPDASEELNKVIERLASIKADEMAWMNPDDTNSQSGRKLAQQVLKDLPPLKNLREEILRTQSKLLTPLNFKIASTGVLLRDGDTWSIRPIAKAEKGQVGVIVLSEPDAGGATAPSIKEIANVQGGVMTVRPAAVQGVPQGTLVFIKSGS